MESLSPFPDECPRAKIPAMQKRWQVAEHGRLHLERPAETQRFRDQGIHPIAVSLLATRGITTAEDTEKFLNPQWDGGIHDPFLFKQMEQAIERIFRALENGERITVHGDYDADGVSGSAVLITTLRELVASSKQQAARNSVSDETLATCCLLPATIDSYIPHRDK